MYAVIRQYKFEQSSSDEIARKVKESLIPLLRKAPGFFGVLLGRCRSW